jgi:phosphoserine phosphatase
MGSIQRILVCFDMDGTLIRNTNSVEYLCTLNHASKELMDDIDRREGDGVISWIAADHERVKLVAGLAVDRVEEQFDACLRIIDNLGEVIARLKAQNALTMLVTAGPLEVAQSLTRRYHFDYCFGSIYETHEGKYTPRIITHLGAKGKLRHLLDLCETTGIPLRDCVAVGDSSSDIELFKNVGVSIGVNCSSDLAQYAHHVIHGNNLLPILPLILAKTNAAE